MGDAMNTYIANATIESDQHPQKSENENQEKEKRRVTVPTSRREGASTQNEKRNSKEYAAEKWVECAAISESEQGKSRCGGGNVCVVKKKSIQQTPGTRDDEEEEKKRVLL